jgi:hypothetical protein
MLKLIQQTQIGLNQEALAEWQAYRAEDLGKPLTPRALKMVERKLLKYSEDEQMRLVENAIEMNWRGIYYVEPPKQASSRQTSLSEDLNDRSWSR